MAEGDLPKGGSNVGNFLKQSTAGLPNWAWILVVGAGIAAAYFVPKFLGSKTSQPGVTSGAVPTVDPATGLPYVPGGPYAGGGNTATGTTGTTTTTTGMNIFQTRPKAINQSDPTYAFDQSNPGVPIRSAPNQTGTLLGYLPFGASINVTGAAITGGINEGNTLWYPVQGGYISAYDLVAVTQSQNTANFVTWPYANSSVYNGARNG